MGSKFGCRGSLFLTPDLALGQPITKCILAMLVGFAIPPHFLQQVHQAAGELELLQALRGGWGLREQLQVMGKEVYVGTLVQLLPDQY